MTSPLQPKVEVKFGTTGVNQVQQGLRLVGKEGEATAQKVGGSMRQIAGGVEAIARQGKVTGEALKQVIASGSEMAFMFGAGGPIIGAIGIVGLAIYEHITGNIKEARDQINKTRTDLENLARGDLMGAATRQQQLYSGEKFAIRKEGESAVEFLARSQGVGGLRNRYNQLAGQLPRDVVEALTSGKGFSIGSLKEGPAKEMAQIVELWKKLNPVFEETAKITANLAEAEGRRSKTVADMEKQDEAIFNAKVAARAAEIARNPLKEDPLSLLGVGGPLGPQFMGSTAVAPGFGGLEGHRAFGIKAAELGNSFNTNFVNPLGESITKSIADGIGGAISAGFDAAFAKGGNLGAALGAFGGVALRTIGGVFKDIGMQSLLGLEFMQTIKAAIMTWNPALGIAASIGLIALGSALEAAGSRAMGAGGGGGGGGGSYSSGAGSTIIDRGIINPVSAAGISPMRSVVNQFTIIGPNDPVAQRQIAEMVDLGNSRRLGRP